MNWLMTSRSRIYLLEMAAAVVPMALRSAVRKGGGGAGCQFIVLVGRMPCAVSWLSIRPSLCRS